MSKICFLSDSENGNMLEKIIKKAIAVAKTEDKNKNKDWLEVNNVKWLKELTSERTKATDQEDEELTKSKDAALFISDLSSESALVVLETSRVIQTGVPTIILAQDLSIGHVRVLKKRAECAIQFGKDKEMDLQDNLVKELGEIKVKSEISSGKNWEYLLHAIKVPIYTLDGNGNIDFFNEAAADFFNINAKNVMGKTPLEFMELIQDSDFIQIHEKYTAIYEKQINESRIALENAKKGDIKKGLSFRDLVFEPLLFEIKDQGLKLCHLKVYNGGSDGSMCIFWSVDYRNVKIANEVLQALKDLTNNMCYFV